MIDQPKLAEDQRKIDALLTAAAEEFSHCGVAIVVTDARGGFLYASNMMGTFLVHQLSHINAHVMGQCKCGGEGDGR